MLSCRQVAVLLSQDIDDELGAFRKLKLKCHLLICRFCRRLRGQLLLQKRAAQMAGEEEGPLPPDVEGLILPQASRHRIKSLLREH